ncbi:autoinducer synthase [Ponticoccus sp. SC2-23]|uniref:acyl-homoserine-lactone synthase n=1 Tax=Alexandriicola marinus TaxID=2081710 RepID=UPI000FD76344|nr:acyl-homoserine-lactone synthase [Alexandriicola marinus]MBM1220162.1 autoinducer synthase [Ponticoccus sp. SC6-9]MBM1224848.1 autoinducer synthase [Ponticoccus sp. SC6-15]MBM1228362.1 autoinducer synthase [Ponticoccus sp. SC6-38]MBM1234001.1 autoinducer synthase [Ponticoccus sp. SC6-45]MBM1238863.1 autoinducer synthase [Ponticoccus sp. SC6-49]MBM1242645.1 autoinducer synthase [Ponticoccus sp. SC2-64]MBM1247525.1 autoinducer synthase [Ponticoccus sp. SC6-42]MBM1251816.1 autoinducer synth
MLRYVYGSDLSDHPRLTDTMFRDRATQFRDRLGWEVTVDPNGWEQDEYDGLDPLYVIWETPSGRHGGSMRFLPTTGQTMINDHFLGLTDGAAIQSPFIWECTRFCLAPEAGGRIAGALMAGGGELMRAFDVTHFVGVFDQRMKRIYRMIGSAPDILGEAGSGRDRIAVGLWEYDAADRLRVLDRAGLTPEQSERWFEQSFGRKVREMALTG